METKSVNVAIDAAKNLEAELPAAMAAVDAAVLKASKIVNAIVKANLEAVKRLALASIDVEAAADSSHELFDVLNHAGWALRNAPKKCYCSREGCGLKDLSDGLKNATLSNADRNEAEQIMAKMLTLLAMINPAGKTGA